MVYRQTAGQLSTRVIQPMGSERSQNRSSSCSPGSGENVQNALNMEDDKTFEVDPGGRAAGVHVLQADSHAALNKVEGVKSSPDPGGVHGLSTGRAVLVLIGGGSV